MKATQFEPLLALPLGCPAPSQRKEVIGAPQP
jgi:hypothetical protein